MRIRLVLVASALAAGCWVWQEIPELNSTNAGADAGSDVDVSADTGLDADGASDSGSDVDGSDAGSSQLVGYWKFDETSGAIAMDSSGKGNNGNVNGASWDAGSLSFDGVDDVVTVPDSLSLDSVAGMMSVFARLRHTSPDAGAGGFEVVVGRQRGGTNFDHYLLAFTSGKPLFIINTATGNKSAIAPSVLQPGVPVDIVGTYDGSSVKLYLNGIEVASFDAGGPTFGADSTPVLIGGAANDDAGTVNELFAGSIDELRLYSRALSPDEVKELTVGDAAVGSGR